MKRIALTIILIICISVATLPIVKAAPSYETNSAAEENIEVKKVSHYKCEKEECKNVEKVMDMLSMSIISIIPAVSLIIFLIALKRSLKERKKTKDIADIPNSEYDNSNNNNFTEETIRQMIPRFSVRETLQEFYNIFIIVQTDYMNFNIDGLRHYLTNDMFEKYYEQLVELKNKNQRNIIKDFQIKQAQITDFKEEDGKYLMSIIMTISNIDYIEENGIPVKGNKIYPVTNEYDMTFVRDIYSEKWILCKKEIVGEDEY